VASPSTAASSSSGCSAAATLTGNGTYSYFFNPGHVRAEETRDVSLLEALGFAVEFASIAVSPPPRHQQHADGRCYWEPAVNTYYAPIVRWADRRPALEHGDRDGDRARKLDLDGP
jgi:hypothetical protein